MTASKGRKRVKTVPWWAGDWLLRTLRTPRWRCTISLLTQRPRPVPVTPLVVKKGLKMRAWT